MAMFSHEELHTSNSIRRTTSLIKELCREGDKPIFTLTLKKEGYISLQKLFVSLVTDDPTEVVFAEEVFGEVSFWLHLSKSKRMAPHLKEWRKVADIKRKQKAFKAIMDEVKEGGRSKMTAARFLIEEPWKAKRSSKAKEGSKETTAQAFSNVSTDYERLKQEGFIN